MSKEPCFLLAVFLLISRVLRVEQFIANKERTRNKAMNFLLRGKEFSFKIV